MLKILWVLFLFFCPFSIFSEQNELPEVLDFKTFQVHPLTYQGIDLQKLAPCAFSKAAEIGAFFDYIKSNFPIDTVIETGSYLGETTLFFSFLFNEVHTIEISDNYFAKTLESLKGHPNVKCHLGSSEKILREILPNFEGKPLIFYLDAHWYSYWPLLNELEEISKTHRDNCIVVVNDIKVPGRDDVPFDSYEGYDCSYDYLKNQLDKIFTEYTVHYLVPEDVFCRAKLIAIPKNLQATPRDILKESTENQILLIENCGVNPDSLTAVLRSRNVDAKVVISNLNELSNPLTLQPRPFDNVSKILFWNIPGNMGEKGYWLKPLKEKMVLFMWEPPLIIKEMYSEEVLNCFSKIYTWDDDLVDNVLFFKFYYPVMYPPIHNPPHFKAKKLCTLITGNGKKDDPNELYSERIKAIEFFETRKADFEFYGKMSDPKGYDFTIYKTYRGAVDDKIKILKNYRFSICYENSKDISGYITEKIFNCFEACNVPIYWGASNIEEYIPKDCFIDRRDFNSLNELYEFMKNMEEEEYEGYIRRIRAFLGSDKAKLFSSAYFHHIFVESIIPRSVD